MNLFWFSKSPYSFPNHLPPGHLVFQHCDVRLHLVDVSAARPYAYPLPRRNGKSSTLNT